MRKFKNLIQFVLIALIFSGCANKKTNEKEKLIIFHAGSLSVPFKQIKTEFEKQNPNIEIFLESAGSVKCARKITELHKDCDIMASADYNVINEMLIPDYASWNIKFASNEMSIVFQENSKYSNEINSQNWYQILEREDVIFGRSDPNSDPCGYRSILSMQLAEIFYKKQGLTKKLINKNQEYIRPKEVDLLALLESSAIDYAFLYRSVAIQHKMNFLILPDSINLKISELNDFYKNASIEIVGKKPGTTITKNGQNMIYGITVLDNAPNKKTALKFVNFLLSQENGQKIMQENGQTSTIPSYSESFNKIPQELKKYSKPNKN